MDWTHRTRRTLGVGLTLAFLLAMTSPPVSWARGAHATAPQRSVSHAASTLVRTTSLGPGAVRSVPSVDTGDLPDERGLTPQAPVPARVERVTPSRNVYRPALPPIGGGVRHLRI